MVTPVALNGAGCATAAPAVSADANNRAANVVIFMNASLLSWVFLLTGDATRTLSPRGDARKAVRQNLSGRRGRERSSGCSQAKPGIGVAAPQRGPGLRPKALAGKSPHGCKLLSGMMAP